MLNKPVSSPRRTHRKRVSALRLSSDTTATLPEYHQSSNSVHPWQRHTQEPSIDEDIPSDKPPDYPDSAEEADEDTDSEDHRSPSNTFLVQQHQPSTGTAAALPRTPHTAPVGSPPRRKQRSQQHKRKHSVPPQLNLTRSETSPVDPFLDALLERSVHALEMSNTLLQSSITTQTSLSTVLACDSPADQTLEARAVNLSAKIRGKWDQQASWMDDLDEITKSMDSLFGEEEDVDDIPDVDGEHTLRGKRDWARHLHSQFTSNDEAGVSCSLPTAVSPLQRDPRSQRRRPSLDLREAAAAESSTTARLRLSRRSREDLIAPPPRALTQYIESGADPAFIALPSTLGIRSGTSIYPNADWNTSTTSLHSTPALPVVTDTHLPSSSTPAFTKLASFVIKRPSNSANATPSSSFTSSFMVKRSNSNTGTPERGRCRTSPRPSPRRSFEITRPNTTPAAQSPLSHQHRPMTPTAEESSSSSDGYIAKQTISCLRKILHEQSPPEDTKSVGSASTSSTARKHAPMPLTPAPTAVYGTSTATASISRMLTKKVHHSSTRPPSPPRQSAMKGSRPTTPSPIVTTAPAPFTVFGDALVVPDKLVGGVTGLGLRLRPQSVSASSSGGSTPKRISFAELPEAHVSSRPDKFRDKGKRKAKAKGKGKGKARGDEESESEEGGGWLAMLFGLNLGVGSGSAYGPRHEERMEDKVSRNWGGRMAGAGGFGHLDEWGV